MAWNVIKVWYPWGYQWLIKYLFCPCFHRIDVLLITPIVNCFPHTYVWNIHCFEKKSVLPCFTQENQFIHQKAPINHWLSLLLTIIWKTMRSLSFLTNLFIYWIIISLNLILLSSYIITSLNWLNSSPINYLKAVYLKASFLEGNVD